MPGIEGTRSEGVVGFRESGLADRSAGDWPRMGVGGGDGDGGGGGMSVPAVREILSGGREGS